MPAVLVTGMSGTGKSTVLAALRDRGWTTVDLEDDWCVPQPDGTRLWDVPAVTRLLDEHADGTIVVAGCEANMSVLLPRFDHVILLTAPWETLDERLRRRTTNPFGATAEQRDKVRRDQEEIEPLLIAIAGTCIDARAPVADVVAEVIRVGGLVERA